MADIDSILDNYKMRKLHDEKYKDATIEEIQRDSLYNQMAQTEILGKIQKSLSNILTIIIVLIVLYVLSALAWYFLLD